MPLGPVPGKRKVWTLKASRKCGRILNRDTDVAGMHGPHSVHWLPPTPNPNPVPSC